LVIKPEASNKKMYEDLEIRCPRLGGEVTFAYCETEGGDLPCPRILLCWEPHLPIEPYLRKKLTRTQWHACFGQPAKDKMTTLIELIEAAKERKGL
jgi:hypothetical protein